METKDSSSSTHSTHIHTGIFPHDITERTKKIVLVGNPNVGKSVFFNYLSGLYVDVSNYPGTTVEVLHAHYNDNVIIDTPGIYGVSSFSDEEQVARDIVLSADIIINVVDASHMERDLFLTLQLIDMGIPLIVALNFMDEAERHGLTIDISSLSDRLGVQVIPTIAVKKIGLADVADSIDKAREGLEDPDLHRSLHEMLSRVGSQPEALLVLEGDPFVSARHGIEPGLNRDSIYIKRRERVNDIVNLVVRDSQKHRVRRIDIGRLVLSPITGIPILALVLYGLYELVAVFIAQTLVGFTEIAIMQDHWEPLIRNLVSSVVDPGSAVGVVLTGRFGILTMTPTYLFGLLLPLVVGFYFALSMLEDSGYLPRLATLVDRVLNIIGLNGLAVVPLILGFGCVTIGTISTRMLRTEREKTIATAILQWVIPCSAQLGIITVLLAGLGAKYLLIYIGIIFITLVIVGTMLSRWLPGTTSPLLLDLPAMRMPRLDNIVRKTFNRSYLFMKEATPWFFIGTLVISLMQVSGLLDAWSKAWEPVMIYWLRLPPEASVTFIMGIIRRDFAAATLYNMNLNGLQSVVALVTMTLFVPCVASVMIMFKERGWKQAVPIWLGSWLLAFGFGGLLAAIML